MAIVCSANHFSTCYSFGDRNVENLKKLTSGIFLFLPIKEILATNLVTQRQNLCSSSYGLRDPHAACLSWTPCTGCVTFNLSPRFICEKWPKFSNKKKKEIYAPFILLNPFGF